MYCFNKVSQFYQKVSNNILINEKFGSIPSSPNLICCLKRDNSINYERFIKMIQDLMTVDPPVKELRGV